MGSKTLPGYLIAIGPIVMLVTFIFLFDALIGGAKEGVIGEAKIKADIEAGMENFALTKLVAFLGLGGMMAMALAILFGHVYCKVKERRGLHLPSSRL